MRQDRASLTRINASLAIACLLFSFSCSRREADSSREITVAAASNLRDAFEEMAKRFTAGTGVRVVYSFGATADLAKQVESGAPFDLFASADVEHVDALSSKGFLAEGSRALYARGRLVLWVPPHNRSALGRVEDVAGVDVRTVAIAKPDVAPYGRAAVEALRALGLWPQVEPRVVYAQNVSQAKQYAASGNADVAFLPLALMRLGEGRVIEVDLRLYQPINQAMGIVRRSSKREAARRFVHFVLSPEGQSLLESFGYLKPAADNL